MGSEYGEGMVKDKDKTEWVQNKEKEWLKIRKNGFRIRRKSIVKDKEKTKWA